MTTTDKPSWFTRFEEENAAQHAELHERIDVLAEDIRQRDHIIMTELREIKERLPQ